MGRSPAAKNPNIIPIEARIARSSLSQLRRCPGLQQFLDEVLAETRGEKKYLMGEVAHFLMGIRKTSPSRIHARLPLDKEVCRVFYDLLRTNRYWLSALVRRCSTTLIVAGSIQ